MAVKRKQILDELKALDDQQLRTRETELRRRLYDLRVQQATDKVADLTQFQKSKKEIARILTLLGQREKKTAGAK
ncbi:MAG TPA: 50S ribosomal protein L29 [Phycisphaerae bacterium]|nr:50S ribosomal protein L29 [Phycisphaerae bacterium]